MPFGGSQSRCAAWARSVPPASDGWHRGPCRRGRVRQASRAWLDALDHAFLIREPEPVVASYTAKRGTATAADLGYAQQAALFDAVSSRRGEAPPVIDGSCFLADPEGQLRALCERLDVPFEPAMLAWPPGTRLAERAVGRYESVADRRPGRPPCRPASLGEQAGVLGAALYARQALRDTGPVRDGGASS